MAGNSQRRGAVRKSGKKPGVVGSGGQRRKALEPKKNTPKAEDRVGHPAARRAAAKERAAQRKPGHRSATSQDFVAGRNPVVEALMAEVPAKELNIIDFVESDDRIVQAISLATTAGIPVRERRKKQLDDLTGDVPHQGIVLVTEPYAYRDLPELLQQVTIPGQPGVLVALDGVTDPHNFGAIARSAAAFGAAGVIIPSRRSASVTPTVWRASAGAVAMLRIAQVSNLPQALAVAADAGCFVLGLEGNATAEVASLAQHFHDVPVVIVIGAEGAGLSRLIAERCDALVKIDMPGGFESLNASVAAGIALYEVARARR